MALSSSTSRAGLQTCLGGAVCEVWGKCRHPAHAPFPMWICHTSCMGALVLRGHPCAPSDANMWSCLAKRTSPGESCPISAVSGQSKCRCWLCHSRQLLHIRDPDAFPSALDLFTMPPLDRTICRSGLGKRRQCRKCSAPTSSICPHTAPCCPILCTYFAACAPSFSLFLSFTQGCSEMLLLARFWLLQP